MSATGCSRINAALFIYVNRINDKFETHSITWFHIAIKKQSIAWMVSIGTSIPFRPSLELVAFGFITRGPFRGSMASLVQALITKARKEILDGQCCHRKLLY
jgi:hypothetical protein